MRFLFVRPEFCPSGNLSTPKIRLSSDSASQRTPLPLAKSSRCRATSGLSPQRTCAHRAPKRDPAPAQKADAGVFYWFSLEPYTVHCLSSLEPGDPLRCWSTTRVTDSYCQRGHTLSGARQLSSLESGRPSGVGSPPGLRLVILCGANPVRGSSTEQSRTG